MPSWIRWAIIIPPVLFVVAWIVIDLIIAATYGTSSGFTISWSIYQWSRDYPAIPALTMLALGILIGHLFTGMPGITVGGGTSDPIPPHVNLAHHRYATDVANCSGQEPESAAYLEAYRLAYEEVATKGDIDSFMYMYSLKSEIGDRKLREEFDKA